jgi:hypothetical protein
MSHVQLRVSEQEFSTIFFLWIWVEDVKCCKQPCSSDRVSVCVATERSMVAYRPSKCFPANDGLTSWNYVNFTLAAYSRLFGLLVLPSGVNPIAVNKCTKSRRVNWLDKLNE